MVHLVEKVGLKCKILGSVLCRFIVKLPNHINDVWSQLVSEQVMHKMSFKLSKANVKGKRKKNKSSLFCNPSHSVAGAE